jgi:hypothetical protein
MPIAPVICASHRNSQKRNYFILSFPNVRFYSLNRNEIAIRFADRTVIGNLLKVRCPSDFVDISFRFRNRNGITICRHDNTRPHHPRLPKHTLCGGQAFIPSSNEEERTIKTRIACYCCHAGITKVPAEGRGVVGDAFA